MCESFKTNCVCGQKTAEIFFGKMVLAESSVTKVFLPSLQPRDRRRALGSGLGQRLGS